MLVELASLESKGGKIAHNYTPGELTMDEDQVSLAAPPRITGRIQRSGARLTFEGQVDAELRVECDRCLKPVEVPVASIFEVDYVTADVYHAEQAAEILEEDLSLSVFDGEVIDIDEIVREQLLLALPFQILCQENCKGLCALCGTDRNLNDCKCQQTEIDPRWAALKEIVDRKS